MNTTVLEKIQSELERSGCDAFLLSGGDNMRYAAQVHLPFTDEHPGLAFVLFAKGRLPLVLKPVPLGQKLGTGHHFGCPRLSGKP